MRTVIRQFLIDRRGVTIIEFAILLPIFLLLVFAVLEFGMAFMKAQVAQRNLATASQAIMADPMNKDNRRLANQSGSSLVDYRQPENFICARSYETLKEAEEKATKCRRGQWNTLPPEANLHTYYVALRSQIDASAMTALFEPFLSHIHETQIVRVTVLNLGGIDCPSGTMPVSDGRGGYDCQRLQDITSCRGRRNHPLCSNVQERELNDAVNSALEVMEGFKQKMQR